MSERQRGASRTWRVLALLGGALVGLNLLVLALDRTTGGPRGPTSSSYATAADGLAAYADLIGRAGHPVVRLRAPLASADLAPSSTLVLLDPTAVGRADARALRRFLESGGRLVAGATRPGRWLGTLVDRPPAWSTEGARAAAPISPLAEVAGVTSIRAGGRGSWSDAGQAVPALAGASATLLVVARVGDGRAALLADTSVLQNRLLGKADNAALGLALAGERRRPVHFIESVHGYGEASGLRAIPANWRFALAGLGLAALVLILARGRRLGPPEPEARAYPPPRREYVESLAGVLARTRRPQEALAPLQAAARERLARRAGLPADAGSDALARTGARVGLTEAETRAVLRPARSQDDVLAAGRALARLERGGGRT